ncbi:MAG: 30S ribosome-binding factor RbfA [Myxococcota bacterium]
MSRRTQRIAEQLRGELARLLREEAADPGIGLVTLTRVDVAPDLSHALVFWSALDVEREGLEESTAAGLERAASFLRHRLAQALPLKRVPELRFRFDPSLLRGSEMISLLRSLSDADDAKG